MAESSNLNARIRPRREWLALLGAVIMFSIGEGIQIGGASNYLIARCLFSASGVMAIVWVLCKFSSWKKFLLLPCIAAMVLLACEYLAPKPTVFVEPAEINFDSAVHKEFFAYSINNQLEGFAYAVQLKVKMPAGSSLDEFSFDLARESRKPIVEGSPLADIGGIRCIAAADNRPTAIFLIYSIEPHGRREIKITHNVDRSGHVDASISGFLVTPPPRTDDITTLLGNIRADEKMTCNGCISFLTEPITSQVPRTCTARKL